MALKTYADYEQHRRIKHRKIQVKMQNIVAKKVSEMRCAECPFATHIDTNRFRCEEIHRIGLEVVRGHWKTNIDCLLPISKKLEECLSVVEQSSSL